MKTLHVSIPDEQGMTVLELVQNWIADFQLPIARNAVQPIAASKCVSWGPKIGTLNSDWQVELVGPAEYIDRLAEAIRSCTPQSNG